MMWIYNTGLRLYRFLVAAISPWHEKAHKWRAGRKKLLKRMAATIAPGEPIAWIHASSLGEFEQGRPIIEALRREHPEYKILLTFFSPSGYEIRKNYPGADYIFYLPIDTPNNARCFLEIVKPEIAIFVKYEYWLNLLSGLEKMQTRTFIVSAIFRRNSIFFKWYGWRWRRALKAFETLFVQNAESKELLAELGFHNVVVAGDTRFDRVADIAKAAKKIDLVERFKGTSSLFVAGSTWGPDEELLVELMNQYPEIKFVVAPHEMERPRIEKLLSACRGGAICYTQCNECTRLDNCQLLILDTMGMLSSVYGYADWAYIGGGFGVGIHNTLEAATFGLPIAFGPNYQKFKEARDMIALGAATSIASAEELKAWFAPLHKNEEERLRVARIAKEYTLQNQGATQTILRTLFKE